MDRPFSGAFDEVDVLLEKGGDDADSASSSSSSLSESPRTARGSRQNSSVHTPTWPLSYRQSMDMYSHLGSPLISIEGAGLTPLGSYRLPSLHRRPSAKPTEGLGSVPGSFVAAGKEEETYGSYDSLKGEPQTFGSQEGAQYVHGLPGQCSTLQGTLNGINVLCGVGILSTPYALSNGGWLSLGVFLLLAILSFYTGILLRRCLDSQAGLETYPDIGLAAFGTRGRVIISVFLYMELYANCVEYLILEGDNLSAVFPSANLSLFGLQLTDSELFIVVSGIIVLPTVLLRDLSLLSYISAIGVIASVVVVICVLWVGVFDGVGFHETGQLLNLPTLPISIGLYGYCYAGHGVFPNIYSSLKKPSKFPTVLIISFVVCSILYGVMEIFGFLMFGDQVQSQITLNLPDQFMASKVAQWCTIINPFTKFALSITPVALSLEELIPFSNYTLKGYGFAICIRTTLVVSTICVALLLPFFGYVMALVGSFLSMLLCLIFPASCFLKIMGHKASVAQKLLCLFIILLGSLCCITGTYSSIVGMIESF